MVRASTQADWDALTTGRSVDFERRLMRVLAATGSHEAGAELAATLRDQRDLALLFRRIASIGDGTGYPLPAVGVVDDWAWHGPTPAFAEMAERLGAPNLVARAERLARNDGARRVR